jgi:asparagine synthase (glutamine-hydrolysing)
MQDASGLASLVGNRLAAGEDMDRLLRRLKGNFALAWSGPGGNGAATDHVRSLPLVYAQSRDGITVSDDPWSIGVDTSALSFMSMAEYATAGFVSGKNTVFADIDALQAGERMTASADGPQFARYYQFLCSYDAEEDMDVLCKQFDDVFMTALERAVASAGNRQIVVPLSAGLDSRLIAAGLKRLGRENVLCFSYGLPENDDAVGAAYYAKEMGLPWRMIPYDPRQIRTLLDSERMVEFWKYSACGVSMPFLTDYPALDQMQREGMVDADAVFIPGQSGDFIVGTHLKYLFDPADNPGYDVTRAIVGKHYLMWENLMGRPRIEKAVIERIEESLAGLGTETLAERAGAYEYWEWQERQCKHVINEARAFEFFGYDWRMPLWDPDVMDFWKRPTIEHKLGAYLYREYLATINPAGVFSHERLGGPVRLPARDAAAQPAARVSHGPIKALLQWRSRFRKHKKIFNYTPSGFPQAYGRLRYLFRESHKRHDGSLLLKDFLNRIYAIEIDAL